MGGGDADDRFDEVGEGSSSGGTDQVRVMEEGVEDVGVQGEGDAGEETKLDPEERERMLQDAQVAKEAGNAHFKAGEIESAIDCYTESIDVSPEDALQERSVFFANRSACYSRLGQHRDVVSDCDAALDLQPGYVKALLRRAQAYEALDDPTSALADMKKVVEVDPGAKVAAAAVPRLQAASDAKLEAQKEEMLGKLKDLGNSVLGRFGMSLDNFKAQKDPNTGSYNISFGQ